MPMFFGAVSPPSLRPGAQIDSGTVRVLPRTWQVSIFDWALLSTSQEIAVEYQLADVLAQGVGAELAVTAVDLEAAKSQLAHFNALLVAYGTVPFFMPFVSTHSINDFSNLDRASKDLADERHERALAIMSGEESVHLTWMTFQTGLQATEGTTLLTQEIVDQAAGHLSKWNELTSDVAEIRILELALLTAPAAATTSQAILHVWTALENLFPNVQSEVSFRLALNLAQLISRPDRRSSYETIRRAYGVRSSIAHGSQLSDQRLRRAWNETWAILTETVRAILRRDGLPNELELMDELLGAADDHAIADEN